MENKASQYSHMEHAGTKPLPQLSPQETLGKQKKSQEGCLQTCTMPKFPMYFLPPVAPLDRQGLQVPAGLSRQPAKKK
jgi:hypothetical protein